MKKLKILDVSFNSEIYQKGIQGLDLIELYVSDYKKFYDFFFNK